MKTYQEAQQIHEEPFPRAINKTKETIKFWHIIPWSEDNLKMNINQTKFGIWFEINGILMQVLRYYLLLWKK